MSAKSVTKSQVDYSLYLVTDSTPAILGGRALTDVVQEAILGGVGIVQFRDKTSETAELIRIAKQLHLITSTHGVPLLINDRVDVALAVGCEGVHLGQDDMDIPTARRLLGPDAIIGATASSIEEAQRAAEQSADYLGIGTLFSTPTKTNTKSIIGTAGTREILDALSQGDHAAIKTVCIGGINSANVQRVLYQSTAPEKKLDGVAVVSAIVAAPSPRDAASKLYQRITAPAPFGSSGDLPAITPDLVEKNVYSLVEAVGKAKPLCHNMTNLVVQNFAANVALSIGASPIMSNNGNEASDLARLGGALVVNMGTVTPEGLDNYRKALTAYNSEGRPILFDPVGAGATQQRRDAVKTLLASGYFDVIKGNESEIKSVLGLTSAQQHGVDSGPSTSSLEDKARLVQTLAKRERCVVLMTGVVDVVSDGLRTCSVHNGSHYLGEITGSGCTLGTTVASFLAVSGGDKLLAVLAGMLLFEIAAERATHGEGADIVHGPGTFTPRFLDQLYSLSRMTLRLGQDSGWVRSANVQNVQI